MYTPRDAVPELTSIRPAGMRVPSHEDVRKLVHDLVPRIEKDRSALLWIVGATAEATDAFGFSATPSGTFAGRPGTLGRMRLRRLENGSLVALVAALIVAGAVGCGDDTSTTGSESGAGPGSGGGGTGGRGAGGGDSGGGSGGEASGTGGAGGDATIDLTCEAGDEAGLVVVAPEHLQEELTEIPEGGEITPGRYALAAVEVYDPLGEEPFPIEPTRALWELARDEARQSFDTFDEQGLPTFGYVLASYATAGTVMTNLLTCATMSFEPGTEAAFEYTARDDAFLTFVRPVEGADLVVLRRYVRQ